MTSDGCFMTGDIGTMDERGYIRIVDRKKDMILVSGFNVYPNEIEGVVAMHPGVLECAAVGIPDTKSGEAVKLFVVQKDPALTADEVIDALPRAPDRLQVPARRRVPRRPAEVERRQDPAARVARRGAGVSPRKASGVPRRRESPVVALGDATRRHAGAARRADAGRRQFPRRHLRRLDHVAGRHRRRGRFRRRGARAAASRPWPSIRSSSSSRC